MEFEWLAALAYPRAIAIHPNFSSRGRLTGPAKLAAQVLEESHHRPIAESEATVQGEEFADRCIAVLRDPSLANLETLERVLRDGATDLGWRACAGIMLTAVTLASGLPRRDLLQAVIDDASRQLDLAGKLSWLWLRLASAVLGMQYGENQTTEIHEIRIALERLEVGNDVDLLTTEGLDLEPTTVFARIIEFVTHAALRWEIDLEQLGGDLWIEGLRRPTPLILSGLQVNVASGYREWTKRTFQERVRRQTQVIGGSLLPGDDNMITAVLVSQFCFHPYSRHAALDLGRARFLRAQNLDADDARSWAVESALSLMRFSGNRETSTASVRYTLRHGPLLALAADLNEVLAAVDRRGNATHLELDYLYEATTLLSLDQARRLFDLLSGEMEGSRSPFPERWTTPWARRESLAKLLGHLSGPAEFGERFVNLLASQLASEGSEDHDRLLSAALRAAPELKEYDAVVLLNQLGQTAGYPMLRASLVARLGETVVSDYVPAGTDEDSMDAAIRYVNEIIVEERTPDADQTRRHAAVVEEALLEMRDGAGKGVQSVGGVEPLDVAVAYATAARHAELWPLIIELLAEPGVFRNQKSGALNRIASSALNVPPEVRNRLKTSLPAILTTEATLFGESLTPFPAALRVAAALELVGSQELMSTLGPWLASPNASDRLMAVSVLGASPAGSAPSWAVQSLLTLTFDADPDVQADAVQVLAHIYPNAGAMQDFIVDRANDLLARDGTWLIRKVLAELNDDAAIPLRERLRSRITGLTRHVDWRVRRAAAVVGAPT